VVGGAANLPPFAQTPNVAGTAGVLVPVNTPLLGGFLKIEMQTAPGTWQDVTLEILNLGIGSPAYLNSNTGGALCADINANAVLRLQRALDNAGACYTTAGQTTNASAPWRWVPNVIFDPREGTFRDTSPGNMRLSGLFHYLELDVRNLSRWFQGAIGATGSQALNVNGYTVYFSDRRGNRDAANNETGEFGFEDFVNPASGAGTPNAVLDVGEDMNADGVLQTYGGTPRLPFGLADWTTGWAALDVAGHERGHGAAESTDLLPTCAEADQRRPRQHRGARADDCIREFGLHSGALERQCGRLWKSPRGDCCTGRLGHVALGQLERSKQLHQSVQQEHHHPA
jgi:hypothetical protein